MTSKLRWFDLRSIHVLRPGSVLPRVSFTRGATTGLAAPAEPDSARMGAHQFLRRIQIQFLGRIRLLIYYDH